MAAESLALAVGSASTRIAPKAVGTGLVKEAGGSEEAMAVVG